VNQIKGLKVVELASVLAGPSVGQFFAELGADVIKVENIRTGGDVTRGWKTAGEQTDDRSAYFCSVNWGKRSIALDLTLEESQRIVHKLALRSDMVIASYKPGDAEKLRVDYGTLSFLNPKLIYGQITGYGPNNPKVGYDAVIQAEAGFMFMSGYPEGPSMKMPVALIDILAGHHLKEGLLLAMIERAMTGKGKLVNVSLIQAAVSSLANQATNWLVANKLPKKQGSAHPNIAPYGDLFITRDDRELLLAVGNDRQFADLCRVLGLETLPADKRFHSNAARVENRHALNEILAKIIRRKGSMEIVRELDELKVPGGLIEDLRQVFERPEARQLIIEGNGLKGLRNFAVDIDPAVSLLPPPSLGQHTEEIIQELR
jgi:crotonobetainyl-CoA:carnitine CoA-transferase CaiB-like acyl-CoA transferase